MDGLGLDRTDDFEKFCGSGLDRIQLYRIRTGLGLKNFTVRSSLLANRSGTGSRVAELTLAWFCVFLLQSRSGSGVKNLGKTGSGVTFQFQH